MKNSAEIKEYIEYIWRKEYANQVVDYLLQVDWEEKVVPIHDIICSQKPKSISKAKRYAAMMKEGYNPFKPLICINYEVIDGSHRLWAYKHYGFEYVIIYNNVPSP